MTTTNDSGAASLETEKDAGEGARGVVRRWRKELDLADKHEEKWREAASDAIQRYRDEGEGGEVGYASKGSALLGGQGASNRFNILFSNVQTICPALYNEMPRPDVRRRHKERDPVGKAVSQIIERALSYAMDVDYVPGVNFDQRMRQAVKDMQLAGRAITRVRYKPYFTTEKDANPDGKPEQKLAYEAVCAEHVGWQDFRMGPGRTWDEVPWVAFRHRLTRKQAKKAFGKVAADVELDYTPEGVEGGPSEAGTDLVDVFKRMTVWEIWHKEDRKVIWIAEGYDIRPMREDRDTYRLEGFFPIARPLYAVETTDSLRPIEPYRFYRNQAIELDKITKRIAKIIDACVARGIYDATVTEFESLLDADDAMMVPAENAAALMARGGIENGVWMWPIDKIAGALVYLYQQREAIKQTIYEITGIADIMRGATDARETLGSQRLKAQFGTMRIDDQKREVQRYARDLIRLKAEIIAEHFRPETLMQMTGVTLPSAEQKQMAQMEAQKAQAAQQPVPKQVQEVLSKPSWEEASQIMRSDGQRGFRIDIETDQTGAGDTMEEQKNVTEFFQALGGFFQAVGPAVETGHVPKEAAVKLLMAGMRRFKFGREVEDAFDEIGGEGQQQQQPQQGQNPEAAKAKAEQQKAQAEVQIKAKAVEIKAQADRDIGMRKADLDAQNAAMEIERKAALAKEKQDADIRLAEIKQANAHEIAKMNASAQAEARRLQAQSKPKERAA